MFLLLLMELFSYLLVIKKDVIVFFFLWKYIAKIILLKIRFSIRIVINVYF